MTAEQNADNRGQSTEMNGRDADVDCYILMMCVWTTRGSGRFRYVPRCPMTTVVRCAMRPQGARAAPARDGHNTRETSDIIARSDPPGGGDGSR